MTKKEKQTDCKDQDDKRLLEASQISLILDTYDDIFSDFDPRPFDHRSLSVDFLMEAKKAAMYKEKGLELNFLIPKTIRNIEKETVIINRLSQHFQRHVKMLKDEKKKMVFLGILLTLLGLFITAFAAIVAYYLKDKLFANILIVVLEPAGWFTIWNGLDMLLQSARGNKDDMEFYEKMTTAEVKFTEYC